jgi:hypothetical protein
MDEVTRGRRKLHNEELRNFHSSPDTIRMIKTRRVRWTGRVASMGNMRNEHQISGGKPEGKRPLGRSRRRWEVDIKIDLRETGLKSVDWIYLAVGSCEHGNEPSGSIKDVELLAYSSDY